MVHECSIDYGRRLVPQVVDELAASSPGRLYAAIPRTTNLQDGYIEITIAQLANCINFMALWLEKRFGRSENFETITYIGLSDLKGIVTLLAAIKTGYKLFVPSPRNPPSVNIHLMSATACNKVLYAQDIEPLIKPYLDMTSSTIFESVPTFQEMLTRGQETPVYPYAKGFDDARNDPIVVLHSSGSTGLPKPITITHGSIAAHDNDHNMLAPAGRQKQDTTVFTLDGENRRLYLVLPFFHLGGFIFFIDHAILNNLTIVLGPPQRAPDAELLKEILHQQRLRVIMVVPAILEQLLHDETAVSMLTDLELVGCAGSPLPGPVGDRISAEVKLRVFIGSTETFPLPELEKDPMDWQYHEFAASLDHEMRPYDAESGTFELIIFANEANKDSAPLFHNLPGIGTFYTKDLFTRHPRNPRLYKYYGPKDDIIVLANGEKINPIPLEQAIQGHTKLKGALLIGNGRTQSLLLIEPKESLEEIEHSTLVQHLWPLIEKANEHIPGPGRVLPGMVLCVLPEKPFVRPGKGSIIRKLTEDLYQDEIDTRYTNRGEEQQITAAGLRSRQNKAYDDAEIVEFLREALGKCFAPAIEIGEDEDFFAHGLDSIRVLEITRALKNNLAGITSNPVTWVAPRFIFQYPTLATLSRVLRLFLNDGQLPNAESAQDRSKALSAMVSLHLENLPMVSKNESAAGHQRVLDLHVAVIGSTGYVGGHVVATLLRSPSVSKIWCLNRASEADARQRTLGKLEADLSDFQEKLAFLRIELRAPRLGLNEDQYRHLVTSVDTILYNAWRLDFGSTLNSFDPFLCATRTIINMSLDSPNKCRIVFTSSTSSVGDLVAHGRKIPEHVIEDALAAINIGYAQSKLAAEIILATASRHCGIPTAVVRVGQVGGLADGGGIWADQPWISSIIQSSKKIGCFPTSVMPIDWVPVDTLSVILASIILGPFDKSQMCQFYNVVSEPQPWTVLLEALPEELCKTISKTISLPHWVERIQQICDTTRDGLLILRASRLLDFYKTLGHGVEVSDFETDRTSIINGQKLAAPTTEVLASWLRSWDI